MKRAVLLLVLLVAGFALGGCGSGKNRKRSPVATQHGPASVPAGGQTATRTVNGTTTTG